MRIRSDYEVFTEAVQWAARNIASNPAKPILGGILLQASSDGTLKLSSHDPEIGAEVEISVVTEEEGTCVVNGKLLAQYAKALPHKEIILDSTSGLLEISCGTSKLSMGILPEEDYPKKPEMPSLAGTVDGALWQEAVAQVAPAASNDDTLPLLVSICIEIDGSNISLLATDRYRLAVRELEWEPKDSNIKARILVRGSRLLDVTKSFTSVGKVEIFTDQDSNMIGFHVGGRYNTIRLFDGEYPEVRSLFPQENKDFVSFNTKDMLSAIARASLVTEKNDSLKLDFSNNQVELGAGNTASNTSTNEILNANIHGEDITLAFSPQYLRDALKSINSDWARIYYTIPSKPAVIVAQNGEDGDTNEVFRLLQMPVRIYN
ncbi:MAG: DNA polymerase III subunit beta [Actinomycetaceae bacterium]|nr:DNA polymerase III subunit beta [Actinomycetaceae bacterium]